MILPVGAGAAAAVVVPPCNGTAVLVDDDDCNVATSSVGDDGMDVVPFGCEVVSTPVGDGLRWTEYHAPEEDAPTGPPTVGGSECEGEGDLVERRSPAAADGSSFPPASNVSVAASSPPPETSPPPPPPPPPVGSTYDDTETTRAEFGDDDPPPPSSFRRTMIRPATAPTPNATREENAAAREIFRMSRRRRRRRLRGDRSSCGDPTCIASSFDFVVPPLGSGDARAHSTTGTTPSDGTSPALMAFLFMLSRFDSTYSQFTFTALGT